MGEVAQIDRPAKAVAPLRAGGNVLAIIPQDIDQVWRMAGMAVAGKMAPKSLVDGKQFEDAQAACAIAIMAGAELGLTPLMALRSYAVVNGRPSLWGDGLKAVVRQSGRCEFIRAGGDMTIGWCEAKRSDTGEVMRREFTMVQAVRAGLDKKQGPWREYPDMMMERRATSRCLNDLFADVLGGVIDQQEAIDGEPLDGPRDVTPVKLTPPSPPSPEPDVAVVDEDHEAATGEQELDAANFFEQLEGALVLTTDEASLEEAWNEADVGPTFDGDALNIEIAEKIKARHLARLKAMKAAPTPPSPPATDPDMFPGDLPR